MNELPPLGIIPRFVFAEKRLWEIDAAIRRYQEAHLPIPPEWVKERNEVIEYLQKEGEQWNRVK